MNLQKIVVASGTGQGHSNLRRPEPNSILPLSASEVSLPEEPPPAKRLCTWVCSHSYCYVNEIPLDVVYCMNVGC